MGRFGKPLCNGGFRRHRGGFAPAWAADVVSSNIVGYEKVNLSTKVYKMGGVQFVNVGGTTASLNDLFKGDIAYGTEIMFLDDVTGAYVSYKYLAEVYDPDADDFVTGWGDIFEELATDPVPNGTGFWFYSDATDGTTVTQAGEVDGKQTVSVEVPASQYTMVINPFPQGFNPNDPNVTWTGLEYGTEIMTLSSTGAYVSYKYLAEVYDPDADDFVPGWGDVFEELVKDDIVVTGEGFWVLAPAKTTITFTSPVAE